MEWLVWCSNCDSMSNNPHMNQALSSGRSQILKSLSRFEKMEGVGSELGIEGPTMKRAQMPHLVQRKWRMIRHCDVEADEEVESNVNLSALPLNPAVPVSFAHSLTH